MLANDKGKWIVATNNESKWVVASGESEWMNYKTTRGKQRGKSDK